jgi:hypothetical protein
MGVLITPFLPSRAPQRLRCIKGALKGSAPSPFFAVHVAVLALYRIHVAAGLVKTYSGNIATRASGHH